jgi:TatD DNase family protein
MKFIDTHAHIYSEQFEKDRQDMLERAFREGIEVIYMPNVDHKSIDGMLELENCYPKQCLPMMGLHPCSVGKDFEKELYLVETWLNKRHFVAVGEMGIDLYWDTTFAAQQEEAFKIQANWAAKYNIPLIIHARSKNEGEAMQKIISLLETLKSDKLFGILHCFTGTMTDAKRLIDLNFKLGIGGVVTYKNGGLEPIIKEIELENLVLETDCPYLAPLPHRGKRNETAFVKLVADKIATIKQIDIEVVAQKTTENAKKLFKYSN